MVVGLRMSGSYRERRATSALVALSERHSSELETDIGAAYTSHQGHRFCVEGRTTISPWRGADSDCCGLDLPETSSECFRCDIVGEITGEVDSIGLPLVGAFLSALTVSYSPF